MEEPRYISRDVSWLSFNYRVLMEAADPNVPLYERIRFLGIYSSNLDEFFRVRVASLRSVVDIDKKKINKKFDRAPSAILDEILYEVNQQQQEFGRIKKQQLIPELKDNGIILYRDEPVREEHREFITHFFKSRVLSYLQPVIISGKNAEVPFLENRALYLITEIKRKGKDEIIYGKVKIPADHLDRFIELPKIDNTFYFAALDDIIRANLSFIFSGYEIQNAYSIKLNRDADLQIEDEFSGDLVKKIEKQIKKRNLGVPSRFLYDSRMPVAMLNYLIKIYKLKREDLVAGGMYHNMHDLMKMPNPKKPLLEYSPQPPLNCRNLDSYPSIFEAITKHDVLLHFPYQSYDYVLRFFNEAALDPDVTHIYATFYRIAEESFISNALISAARNGKKVTVFVEIKARFDEANNLKWAERMEEAGVKIMYSIPGLKVHAKVALVVKENEQETIHYGYYGTGNFNEKTASIYSDLALLTTLDDMNQELLQVFNYLNKQDEKENYQFGQLLISQFNLQETLVELIDREIKHVENGKEGYIFLKLNNLEDEVMIDKLYEASRRGVKVHILVRAICCLIPEKEGYSDNIKVRRIVDRYLEHARIYYFQNNGDEEIYSGSADWMKRNLYRRIEVVFPILEPGLKAEIKKYCEYQWRDNEKGCRLDKKLNNVKPETTREDKIRAQVDYYNYLREKETTTQNPAGLP